MNPHNTQLNPLLLDKAMPWVVYLHSLN